MAALSSDALVSSIQSEIKRVTDNLKDVDDNLRRLTGRDFNETRDPLNFREPNLRDLPNSNFREPKPNLRETRPRGERRIRLTSGGRDDEPPPKRRPPGGVFARLGEPVSDNLRGRRVHEVKEEEGEIARHPKPSLASSVARPVIAGKSRTEAAAELTKDKASRERNRRMFGALLGTLQRFRTEEAKQKGKDEQRAKIEKKLEEKGRAEREKLQREKMQLINQRKEQQAKIKRLQFKMERVKEHEVWEEHQRKLVKFIMTRSKPHIFWVPKLLTSDTSRLISQTKDKIEKDLEEARLRLKEDLDEVLGGRRVLPLRGDEEGEEEEKEGDGEGNEIGFSNCSDLLGYPAEEGELVFEEDVLLSAGKKREDESARRVVVQVDRSGVDRRPQRRVELVTVLASDRSKRVKREGEGNESEKENVLRSKIDARNEGENVENGRMRAREKEREKDKGKEKEREREREKERERDKKEKRKEKEEKDRKGKDKRGHSDNSKALPSSHNESLSKSKKKHKKGRTKEAVIPEPEPEPDPDAESELEEEEEEEPWAEDLSHISLPIEPEPLTEAESDIPAVEVPNLREIVVQHLPTDGTLGTGDDDGGLLQVETVSLPIDPVVIKKDPEGVFPIKKGLPILIIKKEKDPSPPRGHKAVENGVPSPVASPANKEDSDSESSDSSSESEEESSSEEEEEESSSSEEDSSGSSTSSDSAEEKKSDSSDEERRKKSDKGKPAPSASRKRKDSSDSSDSESSDSDDKPSPSKKKTSKGSHRAPSPKPSRRGQDRPGEKRRSGRRSRSRDRRRERSRSRDRRRGRK